MAGALHALGEEGITSLVSTVTWTNRASLRSCARLGYEVLGNTTTFKVGREFGFYPTQGQAPRRPLRQQGRRPPVYIVPEHVPVETERAHAGLRLIPYRLCVEVRLPCCGIRV